MTCSFQWVPSWPWRSLFGDYRSGSPRVSYVSFEIVMTSAYLKYDLFATHKQVSIFHNIRSSYDILSRNAESVELSFLTTDKFLFLKTALKWLCTFAVMVYSSFAGHLANECRLPSHCPHFTPLCVFLSPVHMVGFRICFLWEWGSHRCPWKWREQLPCCLCSIASRWYLLLPHCYLWASSAAHEWFTLVNNFFCFFEGNSRV